MKNIRNLSNYVADKDGNVYSKETGAIIELTDNADYKLQTDEKVYLETLDKTIKLIRRFTPEQIQTLYRQSNDYTDREWTSSNQMDKLTTDRGQVGQVTQNGGQVDKNSVDKLENMDKLVDKLPIFGQVGQVEDGQVDKLSENTAQNGQVMDKLDADLDKLQGQSRQIMINGQVFNSLNEASKELNLGRNTIKRRLDNNTDGYEYI